MYSSIRAGTVVFAVFGMLASTGCSHESAREVGSATLGVELPEAGFVDQVSYRVEGEDIEPVEGTLSVNEELGISGEIGGLPAATGYSITLSAAASDDPAAHCARATSASRHWTGFLYEAEDRTAERDCRERSTHAGYTGRGFMDFGGRGAWVEWNNVHAPKAGNYTLVFRYAVSRSRNRRSRIRVNGRPAGVVEFERTGPAWTVWGEASIDVELEGGNNTVRVAARSDRGGPNLDHMIAVVDEDDRCEPCEGASEFDVVGGASTSVSVRLDCQGDSRTGGVAVAGTFNSCAVVDVVTVAPTRAVVGDDIHVTASAGDADGDGVRHTWTASEGRFADPSAAQTSYRCEEAGDHTLTLQVSDGACGDTVSAQITCVDPAATCGDGALAGDEQCDDGNTESGDGCDENCRTEGQGAPWVGP